MSIGALFTTQACMHALLTSEASFVNLSLRSCVRLSDVCTFRRRLTDVQSVCKHGSAFPRLHTHRQSQAEDVALSCNYKSAADKQANSSSSSSSSPFLLQTLACRQTWSRRMMDAIAAATMLTSWSSSTCISISRVQLQRAFALSSFIITSRGLDGTGGISCTTCVLRLTCRVRARTVHHFLEHSVAWTGGWRCVRNVVLTNIESSLGSSRAPPAIRACRHVGTHHATWQPLLRACFKPMFKKITQVCICGLLCNRLCCRQ